jgi:serine/threonine-protein kinase
MTTLVPGSYVTANVRLVRKLGEGGMGSVWVAEHLTLRTHVAVKFMSTALALDPSASARFSREAASAAQIKSPHVVQTYDHGITSAGVPFIVMELLEGEDLGDRIKRTGPISLADTSTILSQACKALGRAHALGIVHRDIKPDNIFLVTTEDEIYVKLLDFGIAKSTGAAGAFQMTSTGAMMGTPYYMSPEQLVNSKGVDHRADLWSLAVVVYHCVTGTVPFDGETFAGLCIAIDKGTYTPASTIGRQLPPAIDVWFGHALQRNPELRFESAKEMADSFRDVVAGMGGFRQPMVSAPDPVPAVTGLALVHPPTLAGASVSTSTTAPKRSNLGIVVAAGLGISLLILAGAGVLLYKTIDSSDGTVEASADPAASVTEVVPTAPPDAGPAADSATAEAPDAAPDAPAPATTPSVAATTEPVRVRPAATGTRTPRDRDRDPPARTDRPPKPVITEVDRGF